MPVYAYRALAFDGRSCSGRETADTIAELGARLEGRDLVLQSAKAERDGRAIWASRGARIPLAHLADFNRQFVVLLEAGLPVVQALGILAERRCQPQLERTIRGLIEAVGQGASLSQALERDAAAFEPAYKAVVVTGERSGALADCLARYQSFIDLRVRLKAQIGKAMLYPAVLLTTLVLVLAFLFTSVIPNFVAMFAELGSDLPGPTQALMAVADRIHWIALGLAAGAVALVALDRAWCLDPVRAARRDRWMLDAPVLGPVRRTALAARLSRMLATLVQAGTPAAAALEVARGGIGDRHAESSLGRTLEAIRGGRRVSDALADEALLPPESIKMLVAGEASGRLGAMLDEVARHQETELERRLTRATGLAEPLLVLTAGLVVGGIIVAMYLPIFSMAELIG